MVGISLQDDVKRSFEKVRDDILALKRSLNRELLAIEEMSGCFQTVVVKDEFYSFVKRLGERLDRIDDHLEAYLGYEDDIKNVDAKVNSLGKKLSRQEDLGNEVKGIRRLNGKLEALEGSAISAQKFNESIGKILSDVSSVRNSMLTGKALDSLKTRLLEAEKKVESLEKSVPSKDEISASAGAVKELREMLDKAKSAVTKKVEALEGSAISAQKFNEAIGKVSSDVSHLKSAMLTGKALDSLKTRLLEAEKKVESLEKSVPLKSDVSGSVAAVEELRESVRMIEVDSQKRLEDIENNTDKKLGDISGSLKVDIGSIKASFVDKSVFEKSLKELRKEDASIRGVLESSVSEVDFSDYVTRKELGKKLLAIDELNSDLGRVAQNASELERGLESLRKGAASIDDVKSIVSDVKGVSRSLDSLKAAIEKAGESSQKRCAQDLEQVKARLEKELARLRDDFEDKLRRVEKEKAAPASPGLLARVGKGVAEFFREDEEDSGKKERKVKPAPTVSELLKEDEKKKPGKRFGFSGFLMIAIMIVVVIAGFVFVFFLASAPEGGIEDAPPEDANESAADGLVGSPDELAGDEGVILIGDENNVNASQEVPANDSVEPAAPGTLEYCQAEFECKERGDGSYWFSCYLDEEGTCRCFVTGAEGCGMVGEASEKPADVAGNGKFRLGYAIAAVVAFALFMVVYISAARNRVKNGKKPGKKEKEAEEDDGNGVDLEEFFHKK